MTLLQEAAGRRCRKAAYRPLTSFLMRLQCARLPLAGRLLSAQLSHASYNTLNIVFPHYLFKLISFSGFLFCFDRFRPRILFSFFPFFIEPVSAVKNALRKVKPSTERVKIKRSNIELNKNKRKAASSLAKDNMKLQPRHCSRVDAVGELNIVKLHL